MKKAAILLVLLALFGSAPAQQVSELSVTGVSSISLKPTETVITFTVRSTQNSYVAAVEDMTRRVDELAGILKALKFKDDELITSNFSIQEKFAYDRGQRRNDGYVAVQTLRVSFSQDKKRLLDVLSRTTSGTVNAELAVAFTLDATRQGEVELQLIESAVKDARMKAETIARASGYKVTGIKDIAYGGAPVDFPRPGSGNFQMRTLSSAEAGGVDVSNFEAAELTLSDRVQMVFVIAPEQ